MRYLVVFGCIVIWGLCSFVVGCGCPRQSTPQKPDQDGLAESEKKFVTTPSGLKYCILRESGGRKPRRADTITLRYRGWVKDNTEFYPCGEDGTKSYCLAEVIPGWQEGLQHIDEGGVIELEVPAELGYGVRGVPGKIPPNAILCFHIELIKIE